MASSTKKPRPNFNPFDVLGVKVGCTEAEIDKAYKKKALKWHPDKNLDNTVKAQEMFIKVYEAYEFLKDSSTRVEYEEAEIAKQRRATYDAERRATSSAQREHFRSTLEQRERNAQNEATAVQKTASKRKSREQREAAAERKRARDSDLEKLAREASEMMARKRAELDAEKRKQQTTSNGFDASSLHNMTADELARLEEEVLGGAL